jgi:flagellin
MALTLDTNINSLNAQRNLNTSQASLSTALQRLSSGLRINSAADDAAGLAISSQFTTQINGTNQAVNNANNAISEAQTAGGALSTLTDSLQSIRTLAVEAANGSNSASDRAALDQQVQQQISEITRIASQTSFNGLNVLDGSSGVTTYQVGANVGNTISINLAQGVRADQIGQYATSTNTVTGTALATGDLSLQVGNGPVVSVAASVAGTGNAGQTAGSAYALAQSINSAGVTGLTATATTSTAAAAFTTVTSVGAVGTYALSINGVNVFGTTGLALASGGTLTQSQVTTAINAVSGQTGVIASADSTGKLVLTAADGSNITAVQTLGGAAANGAGAGTTTATFGQLTVSSASAITVGGAAGGPTKAGLTTGTIAASSGTLSTQDVLDVAGANATIQAVDSALATVSAFQSQLGAIQNRFTSTVANLQSTAQNLTASRSTIQDTNFASETANLTQSQVLQQAGISVLAQANSEPQLILKLLP